eukprot:1217079-Rhodomonas_salina.2
MMTIYADHDPDHDRRHPGLVVFARADVLRSVERSRGNHFVVIELGASWGTWGVRAVAAYRRLFPHGCGAHCGVLLLFSRRFLPFPSPECVDVSGPGVRRSKRQRQPSEMQCVVVVVHGGVQDVSHGGSGVSGPSFPTNAAACESLFPSSDAGCRQPLAHPELRARCQVQANNVANHTLLHAFVTGASAGLSAGAAVTSTQSTYAVGEPAALPLQSMCAPSTLPSLSFRRPRVSCVLSCRVLSCLILSCLVLSYLALSCLVLPCLVLSCLVLQSCVSSLPRCEAHSNGEAYRARRTQIDSPAQSLSRSFPTQFGAVGPRRLSGLRHPGAVFFLHRSLPLSGLGDRSCGAEYDVVMDAGAFEAMSQKVYAVHVGTHRHAAPRPPVLSREPLLFLEPSEPLPFLGPVRLCEPLAIRVGPDGSCPFPSVPVSFFPPSLACCLVSARSVSIHHYVRERFLAEGWGLELDLVCLPLLEIKIKRKDPRPLLLQLVLDL